MKTNELINLLKMFRDMNEKEKDKIIKGFEQALIEERILLLNQIAGEQLHGN